MDQTQLQQLIDRFENLSLAKVKEMTTSPFLNKVYSFSDLLQLLRNDTFRICWDFLAPHFPVHLDRKTYPADLDFLRRTYELRTDQLVITNQRELTFYCKMMTAARYGLVDLAKSTLEAYRDRVEPDIAQIDSLQDVVSQEISCYPEMILEIIEEAIKSNQLDIAKLAVDYLTDWLVVSPESMKQLISIICHNASLPMLQYCEEHFDIYKRNPFTNKVEEVACQERVCLSPCFLDDEEQVEFNNYLVEKYHYPFSTVLDDANI